MSRVEDPLLVNDSLTLTAAELDWRFSRSSGPGGQSVNTADSRVELSWTPANSVGVANLPEPLRDRLLHRIDSRLVNGALVIAASEQRAQLRNREAARGRLAQLLREALAPPPRRRRPTRPTRGSVERRLDAKRRQAERKRQRNRPDGS